MKVKKKSLVFGGESSEELIKNNLKLNLLSSVVSLMIAIALFVSFFGQEYASVVIALAAGLLGAMSFWQFTTFYNGLRLRRNFARRREDSAVENQTQIESAQTKELLSEADFSDAVPISVTENTTRHLSE